MTARECRQEKAALAGGSTLFTNAAVGSKVSAWSAEGGGNTKAAVTNIWDADSPRGVQLRDGTVMTLDVDVRPDADYREQKVHEQATALDALRIRIATARYDCWGLVLAGRRGWPVDFKDDPHSRYRAVADREDWDGIERSLTLDGYRRVGTATPKIGAVVTYRATLKLTHVGVVVGFGHPDLTPMVLSKWGLFGEYLHRVDRVLPVYGVLDSYWELEE